jgi:hypothetical protein
MALPPNDKSNLQREISNYFLRYDNGQATLSEQPRVLDIDINDHTRIVKIHVSNSFATQELTTKSIKKIYKKINKIISSKYDQYNTVIMSCGLPIELLAADATLSDNEANHFWGNIDYHDEPWVANESKPYKITHGLYDRHIALWASHGRYYDNDKGKWKWQRPNLFGTTEDLFTQTIVVPYLIPMLQNAGAYVFTPRERDWQANEYIVDNDVSKAPDYLEINVKGEWEDSGIKGFSFHEGTYKNGENPFEQGTARMIKTTKSKKKFSLISYQPTISTSGKYAVYVSYKTLENSIPDAEYIVYHKGAETHFRVNQTMGGSTWVYLGTFEFDKGNNQNNRVVITNNSQHHGVVTADAVRFGGGMGNIERGGSISGYPRCLEGARYSAQWAGAPTSVYDSKNNGNDYGDDINVRPYMSNWLAGGSCYVPTIEGEKVPIELSLAVHSDAGFDKYGDNIIGSLAICTTNFNEGRLSSGVSRMVSKDFAQSLLDGFDRDLTAFAGKWNRRYLWDKNYSETRNPEVPSAIIETLSHQSFPDMKLGQDPNFKFCMARSLYKSIVRYINNSHGKPTVIQPLAPKDFKIEFISGNEIKLSWKATEDKLEPTACPTTYNIYTAIGSSDFDNGSLVTKNYAILHIIPGIQYNFRITAVNRGGESFPTETLSTLYQPSATKTVLVVNGFDRLSAPAVVDNDSIQGFDFNKDPGVSYGITAGWNGKQICFDKNKIGIEGPGGLGYSGDEMAGSFIDGNDFNYVKEHTQAIATAGKYNVVSCSAHTIENGEMKLSGYDAIDLILGLQKYDAQSSKYYKTFTTEMQKALQDYTLNHGNIIVSGSYIASDMETDSEKAFLKNVLKIKKAESDSINSDLQIKGLGKQFYLLRSLNAVHYAATSSDEISPIDGAICAMQYDNGSGAAVGYQGTDYNCFSVGFPLECIASSKERNDIIRGILNYVMPETTKSK